jgi:hydrogenase expression/formation protein HypC
MYRVARDGVTSITSLFSEDDRIRPFEVSEVCLAIPGKVLETEDRDGLRVGKIQFGGIVRSARLDFVPEANTGDYVMVHVGFAISKVDESEAERTYHILREMGVLENELPPEDEDSASEKSCK